MNLDPEKYPALFLRLSHDCGSYFGGLALEAYQKRYGKNWHTRQQEQDWQHPRANAELAQLIREKQAVAIRLAFIAAACGWNGAERKAYSAGEIAEDMQARADRALREGRDDG